MDLALIPRISRCSNLSFIRKVAMNGPKSVLSMGNKLNVFRVARWAFTPASLLQYVSVNESSNAVNAQGSWNLDGGWFFSIQFSFLFDVTSCLDDLFSLEIRNCLFALFFKHSN